MPRKSLIIKLILADQLLAAAPGANVGNATKGTFEGPHLGEGPMRDAVFCLTLEYIPGLILLA
jgi:hypothetical protein